MTVLTLTFLIGAGAIALATIADPYEITFPNGREGGDPTSSNVAWPRWVTVWVLSILAFLAHIFG